MKKAISNTKQATRKTEPSATGSRAPRPAADSRQRLDVAVAERAAISRERARGLILAGHVRVNGVPQRKAGTAVAPGAVIEIESDERYVSRGGYKLEHALRSFRWSPSGLRCLDVGASTGGFTDCLLRHGAHSVTAVDVGYGHLAWSLRQDPRVKVVERCNFRYAEAEKLGAPFDFICADVSFISLTKLAAKFAQVLAKAGRIVALVKPQFEAGRQAVARGGVVRDQGVHIGAIDDVITAFAAAGLATHKLTYSPLRGPAGNIEFLLGAVRDGYATETPDAAGVVREAHEALAS